MILIHQMINFGIAEDLQNWNIIEKIVQEEKIYHILSKESYYTQSTQRLPEEVQSAIWYGFNNSYEWLFITETLDDLINIDRKKKEKLLSSKMNYIVHGKKEYDRIEHDWITLKEIRPGMLFITNNGFEAIKSSKPTMSGDCQCLLLLDGRMTAFREDTLVKEIMFSTKEEK
jgi:hypothetical protein